MFEAPIGKKVYTIDGDYIGEITSVDTDELGNSIVIIKTVFEGFPELKIEFVALRKITKEDEEVYIAKSIPVKLKEIIAEKKRLEEIRKLEEERIKATIPQEEAPYPKPPTKNSLIARIIAFLKRIIAKITGKFD